MIDLKCVLDCMYKCILSIVINTLLKKLHAWVGYPGIRLYTGGKCIVYTGNLKFREDKVSRISQSRQHLRNFNLKMLALTVVYSMLALF